MDKQTGHTSTHHHVNFWFGMRWRRHTSLAENVDITNKLTVSAGQEKEAAQPESLTGKEQRGLDPKAAGGAASCRAVPRRSWAVCASHGVTDSLGPAPGFEKSCHLLVWLLEKQPRNAEGHR